MRSGLPSGRIGLAVSVVVHAAAAIWLFRLPAPPPPTRAPVQLDIVVTQRPPTRIVAPPPAPARRPAAPDALARPPDPARRPAAPDTPARPPDPARRLVAPDTPTRPPDPARRPAAPDAHARPPDPAPTPAAIAGSAPVDDAPRAGKLDLSLKGDPTGSEGIPVVRRELRLGPENPTEKSPSELITAGQNRRRVENGLVDPYFAQLGKALIDHWNAEAHVRRSGVRGWMQQMSENTELLTSIWQKNAKRYAATGNLLSDGEVGGYAVPTAVDRTGGLSARAARDAYNRQLKEQFTARKRALIRVVQNLDGTLRSVTLLEGSNEPAIDREALADVRAAASKLPPPPPEGLGIKEPIVSLWEFQLTVSISPPVPTVSIEFDEALAFLDVRMPLDRRIYKRVKLVAVE